MRTGPYIGRGGTFCSAVPVSKQRRLSCFLLDEQTSSIAGLAVKTNDKMEETSAASEIDEVPLLQEGDLVTDPPWFESPVAYDSMATRGSRPNALAESAEAIAMDASSSALGLVLMAQSPYTRTLSGRHMKKMLETTGIPGSIWRGFGKGLERKG